MYQTSTNGVRTKKIGGFKINVPVLWSLHIMMVLVHMDANRSSVACNFTKRSRVFLVFRGGIT